MLSNSTAAATLLAACWIHAAVAHEVCPSRHEQPLRYVDVFDGTPRELATLMPDKSRDWSGSWNLGYIYDAGRVVTIRCKYADGQLLDVTLSDRVSKCNYRIDAKKTLHVRCK